MSSVTSGATSVSEDALNLILCEFVADRRCACVCKRWSETMQKHFSLVASNHFLSGTLIKSFMARALSPRLTLEGLQNQGRAAVLENTASLVFRILRIESRSVTIDQIMCLRTPNIERLIQSNKDKNLVSFYNILKTKIAVIAGVVVPDFTEAGDVRNWMRGNPALLAQIRRLNEFDCIITEIPEEINLLTGLTHLFFRGPKLVALPDELNFPELQFLDLRHMPIATLPNRLNAPKLRDLCLRHTQITAFSDRLNFPELHFLDLSCTRIATFPDGFNAPKLRGLNLEGTQLASFPNTRNFPELQFLGLREAQITTLPDRLNVHWSVRLSLTYTQIAIWPSRLNFFELAALRLRDAIVERFTW